MAFDKKFSEGVRLGKYEVLWDVISEKQINSVNPIGRITPGFILQLQSHDVKSTRYQVQSFYFCTTTITTITNITTWSLIRIPQLYCIQYRQVRQNELDSSLERQNVKQFVTQNNFRKKEKIRNAKKTTFYKYLIRILYIIPRQIIIIIRFN